MSGLCHRGASLSFTHSALLLALSGLRLQDSGSEGSRLRRVAWEARMPLRLCPTGSCTRDPWTFCPTHHSEVEGGRPARGLGFADTPAAQRAGPLASLCLRLQSGLSRARTGSGEGPQPQTSACNGTPSSRFCAWGRGGEAPGWSSGPLASQDRWVARPCPDHDSG